MPKYLAIDHLTSVCNDFFAYYERLTPVMECVAVSKYQRNVLSSSFQVKEVTRSLLERMLLPSPQHLEFVNPYAHRGECPESSYLTPWTIGIALYRIARNIGGNYTCIYIYIHAFFVTSHVE